MELFSSPVLVGSHAIALAMVLKDSLSMTDVHNVGPELSQAHPNPAIPPARAPLEGIELLTTVGRDWVRSPVCTVPRAHGPHPQGRLMRAKGDCFGFRMNVSTPLPSRRLDTELLGLQRVVVTARRQPQLWRLLGSDLCPLPSQPSSARTCWPPCICSWPWPSISSLTCPSRPTSRWM